MKRDPGCLCYITKEALKNQFLLEQGFVFSSRIRATARTV